jgi:hypothetical protein
MPSFFASGLAEGVQPFAKALAEEQFKKRERKQKAQEAPSQVVNFVNALKEQGIPIEQLSSVNPQEGTVGFRQQGSDLSALLPLLGVGSQITKVTRGGITAERDPGVIAQQEAEGKALQKEFETSEKLSQAVRRLSVIKRQFQEALPSEGRSALAQRVTGNLAVIGAKMGLKENPQLLALQTNIRPIAINLIRLFGEVGNLSESEQKGAIDVVQQSGLTDDERLAKLRQFAEFALAGASPRAVDFAINRNPDIRSIVDAFGINLSASEGLPGQQSSISPDKVKVIRLSDGKQGTIDASDFDPEKYERR